MLNGSYRAFSEFKDKLTEGRPVFGIALTSAETSFAEMAGLAGFDFAWIEMEHTTLSFADVERQIIALENCSCVPMVRVRRNEANCIGQVLDMGARIVNIPHVDTVEDARNAVMSAKYYPLGRRGYATVTRSTQYGTDKLDTGMMARKNMETMLMVQIESVEAVANAGEIAALDGVDALFVGYADLCQDMGLAPDPHHPRCREAIETVGRAVRATGKTGAFIVTDPSELADYHDLGFDMIICGMDSRIMKAGIDSLSEKFRRFY